MRTYDYRCSNCEQPFSLTLSDAQHEELSRSLREHRPMVAPSFEHPHCRVCDTADLVPVVMPSSKRMRRES